MGVNLFQAETPRRKIENFSSIICRKSEEADEEEIFHAVSRKSENILQSVTAKSPIRLSWTHYRIILQESNKEARDWYEQEAAREMWGTRTLQRNVSSQYYHRLLQSQNKDAVRGEMKQLTAPLKRHRQASRRGSEGVHGSKLPD